MTREELLALVNKELGSTKLTLNERAINEELDDSLGDFGDDEAANAKMVTRIANRLKRMDGSVHTAVSHEVEEYKKNHKPKEPKKDEKNPNGVKDKGDDDEPTLKDVLAELKAMKDEREAEKAAAAKKDLLASVSQGLKDKFAKAGMEVNSFFLGTALKELELPEKDADVSALVDEAERIYTRNRKAAGMDTDGPHSGNSGDGGKPEDDSHLFDDIKARRARYNPNPASK